MRQDRQDTEKAATEKAIECALSDPEKVFKTPEAVLADPQLTEEEKKQILRCWEQDELGMMRAEEENMTPKTDTPSAAEVLEKVKEAEETLEKAYKKGKKP